MSTKAEIDREIEELLNSDENNVGKAMELITQLKAIQDKCKRDYTERNRARDEQLRKMEGLILAEFKKLQELDRLETVNELKKVEENMTALREFSEDSELARSVAAMTKDMPPSKELVQIYQTLIEQFSKECPVVKAEEPRLTKHVTGSEKQMQEIIDKAMAKLEIENSDSAACKFADGFKCYVDVQKVFVYPQYTKYGVMDAVYCEFKSFYFVSCKSDGVYEAGAGGARKVHGDFSVGLCLSLCGEKLYSGSTGGSVNVYEIEEEGDLRLVQTLTVPGGRLIGSLSISDGGRLAVLDTDSNSVSVLTTDGERELHLKRDAFGGSKPRSVQWVGEKSLFVSLRDDKVMLFSLDSMHPLWSTAVVEPWHVSSSGDRLYVSSEGLDTLITLDQQTGAIVGAVSCTGSQAVKVFTLQDKQVAALSFN